MLSEALMMTHNVSQADTNPIHLDSGKGEYGQLELDLGGFPDLTI